MTSLTLGCNLHISDIFFYLIISSIQEKDEKLKTVEELLETGLIQVATKEEELNVKHFMAFFFCGVIQ